MNKAINRKLNHMGQSKSYKSDLPEESNRDAKEKSEKASTRSYLIKVFLFVALVLQNTVNVECMRESFRTEYSVKTAVLLCEVVKFVVSLFVCLWSFSLKQIFLPFITSPRDKIHILVIAAIYNFQNVINYIALKHLQSIVFQIVTQLKIIMTALFSILLLNRSISRRQWVALFMLAVGVALVQVDQQQQSSVEKLSDAMMAQNEEHETEKQNLFIGLSSVLISSVTSGFAGNYFEKVIKHKTPPQSSLWTRNLELSLFSIVFSCLSLSPEWTNLSQKGFFHGYNSFVVWSILTSSLGGFLVSMLIKYSNNITKSFCISFSIVLCGMIDVMLYDFRPSQLFICGFVTVLLSVHFYVIK